MNQNVKTKGKASMSTTFAHGSDLSTPRLKHYCPSKTTDRWFQVYAEDAQGNMVWCAPKNAPRMSAKIARKIQRNHMEWRFTYDHSPENLRRDYPAKHTAPVVSLVLVAQDGTAKRFYV